MVASLFKSHFNSFFLESRSNNVIVVTYTTPVLAYTTPVVACKIYICQLHMRKVATYAAHNLITAFY